MYLLNVYRKKLKLNIETSWEREMTLSHPNTDISWIKIRYVKAEVRIGCM